MNNDHERIEPSKDGFIPIDEAAPPSDISDGRQLLAVVKVTDPGMDPETFAKIIVASSNFVRPPIVPEMPIMVDYSKVLLLSKAYLDLLAEKNK